MFESNDFLTINWTDDFLKERINLTRVWNTLNNGIEIQELKLNRIDDVIKMIKEYYIIEEPLMDRGQMCTDDNSVEEYLYLARLWMMDSLSTIAVEQETGNIVGFIINRFNYEIDKNREFSRERIYEGKIWNELQKFKHYLTKRGNAFEHHNVKNILEIYSWFVLPEYRNQGIGKELLKNVMLRQLPEYEWSNINVITGVFTNKVSQHIAESLGMETLYEFIYAGWIAKNEVTGEPEEFFKKATSNNYSAKVMSKLNMA